MGICEWNTAAATQPGKWLPRTILLSANSRIGYLEVVRGAVSLPMGPQPPLAPCAWREEIPPPRALAAEAADPRRIADDFGV